MHGSALLIRILLLSLTAGCARARFIQVDLKPVPLATLITNLEKRLANDSNDVRAVYYLARVHSIAYATNSNEIPIWTDSHDLIRPPDIGFARPGNENAVPLDVQTNRSRADRDLALQHVTKAVEFYKHAAQLIKSEADPDSQWLILPIHLGLAWCIDQSGDRQGALKAYRTALELAWHKEVIGDFTFKDWIEEKWDKIRAGENPLRSMRRGYVGPGVCYSDEIIGYMLALLDPVKDAGEIARLK